MNRRILLVLAALGLVVCIVAGALWMRGGDRSLQRKLEARIASGADSFDFAAETPFAWERMFIFAPYTTQVDAEASLGFLWPDFRRTGVESSDSATLVVFTQGASVVHWFEQPRTIDLAALANKTGYARSEARFAVNRAGGRALLSLPAPATRPAP